MGIRVITGNLLDAKTEIIAHQVNCQGVMGAGVALAIREKWPQVYESYRAICKAAPRPDSLLGMAQIVDIQERRTLPANVANLFGQCGIGHGSCQTNYPALEKAMENLKKYMTMHGLTYVAMPYGIGCGLAGGNWDVVEDIITRTFDADSGINVELWKLGQ